MRKFREKYNAKKIFFAQLIVTTPYVFAEIFAKSEKMFAKFSFVFAFFAPFLFAKKVCVIRTKIFEFFRETFRNPRTHIVYDPYVRPSIFANTPFKSTWLTSNSVCFCKSENKNFCCFLEV